VNQKSNTHTKMMGQTQSISKPLDAGLLETGFVYNPKEFGDP